MATILVNGVEFEAVSGTRLSDVLAGSGIAELPCGGNGRCGKCKVRIAGKTEPPTDAEKSLLSEQEINNGIRLACRTVITGGCTVTTASKGKSLICADGDIHIDGTAPAFVNYGAAIDIGTTTLAAMLFDKNGLFLAQASRINPQTAFGADVISRIDASMNGFAKALSASVVSAVDEMLYELAEKADIECRLIDGLVLTGNTVMLSLFTGTSVEPLSHAPFSAVRVFGENIGADESGLKNISPVASVYLPKCASAFIGADVVCALLAGGLCDICGSGIMADIGTNGEIALWHDGRLFCCSVAAGPALEGVGISMGMHGGVGAVDHVDIVNGELCAHVIGEEKPVGICGSGVVDAAACLLMTEQADKTGLLDDETAVIAPPVCLTQSDMRMIQLAKSAVHAGILALLSRAGLRSEDVSTLQISGGFGSYLDVKKAEYIGLFPKGLSDKVRVLGNGALSGAAMLLLDKDLRPNSYELASSAEVIELAADPVFEKEFINNMNF